MDPLDLITGLFRLGNTWSHLRQRLGRALHRLLRLNLVLAFGVMAGGIALVLAVVGIERELALLIGEVAAPLALATALALLALLLILRTVSLLRAPVMPPAAPHTGGDEFSTGAGLALVAGIIVGILLQNRKDAKE